MRVFRFVPLALAVLLTGCLGGDVGRVKDSKLKGWPQYTVGQLLDKRQVCSSTKWHSFTDKRDRKIVEYVCEYAPAKAYLEKITEEKLESFERSRVSKQEHQTNMLIQKRQALEKAIESHNEVLATKEALQRGEYEPLRIAQRDHQLANAIQSCAEVSVDAFGSNEMRTSATSVVASCNSKSGINTLGDLVYTANWRLKVMEQRYKGSIENMPRQISNSESQVRVLRTDLDEELQRAEKEAQAPEYRADDKKWLRDRLAAFEGVKEISQWTMIDGEPTYLGSRVDAVFENQPVEVPVDALFVFNQAADDPAGLTPLYEYLLQRMFAEFNVHSEK